MYGDNFQELFNRRQEYDLLLEQGERNNFRYDNLNPEHPERSYFSRSDLDLLIDFSIPLEDVIKTLSEKYGDSNQQVLQDFKPRFRRWICEKCGYWNHSIFSSDFLSCQKCDHQNNVAQSKVLLFQSAAGKPDNPLALRLEEIYQEKFKRTIIEEMREASNHEKNISRAIREEDDETSNTLPAKEKFRLRAVK